MLLYHAIRKTYDDFEKVYRYRLNGKGGALVETDKELKKGLVIIVRDVNEYAAIVKDVWKENGQKYFTWDTAEEIVVRGRDPIK